MEIFCSAVFQNGGNNAAQTTPAKARAPSSSSKAGEAKISCYSELSVCIHDTPSRTTGQRAWKERRVQLRSAHFGVKEAVLICTGSEEHLIWYMPSKRGSPTHIINLSVWLGRGFQWSQRGEWLYVTACLQPICFPSQVNTVPVGYTGAERLMNQWCRITTWDSDSRLWCFQWRQVTACT